MSKKEVNKEKIRFILQFLFDRGESANQAAAYLNEIYGPNTVTVTYAHFWFLRFQAGNFDVKDEPNTGSPTGENVDKIMEEEGQDSCRSIAKELRINHKVLNHLQKAELKKNKAEKLTIDRKKVLNHLPKAGLKKKRRLRAKEPPNNSSEQSE